MVEVVNSEHLREKIIQEMDEEWNPMVVRQDPTEGFRQGVEEFRAAFATEDEPNGEVLRTTPAEAEEMPEVGVDREDFESTGDVCFREP